jgi:hypothetical protein
MISPVVPGTVGFGHGSGFAGASVPPTPTPPDVALAVGVEEHWLGLLPVTPLGAVGAAGTLGGVVAPVLVPPAAAIPPPPVLALAAETLLSANAAKLGSIRWATRKRSLSWACGVS